MPEEYVKDVSMSIDKLGRTILQLLVLLANSTYLQTENLLRVGIRHRQYFGCSHGHSG